LEAGDSGDFQQGNNNGSVTISTTAFASKLAAIAYRTPHRGAPGCKERGAAESAEVENLGNLINEALVQTRGVAHGLFPVRLEENGLVSALAELSADICRPLQNQVRFLLRHSAAADG